MNLARLLVVFPYVVHSFVMEINGLPLHVLVVHAAVVLAPLAGLAAVAYAVVPRWRDWLRWPVAVGAVVALATVWAAWITGDDFLGSDRFASATGEFADRLDTHADRGNLLRWVASGFGVVTLAAVWLHDRTGPVRVALSAGVVLLGLATVVATVLTGDAGAQAVWGS